MRLEESHPTTELKQAEILRRMGGPRRLAVMASLSAAVIRLSRRAIRRTRPHASKAELDIAFIELVYGRELADRVRKKLTP